MTSRNKSGNRHPKPSRQYLPGREERGAKQAQQTPGKEDVSNEQVVSRLEEPLSKERVTVPLVAETLQVDKRWVEAGAIELRKSVTKRTETVPVDLTHEELDIERVAVNRVVAYGQTVGPRQEGDTLIVPIIEEELVVTKRQVVREELRIRKKAVVTHQEISDTLRSEELEVSPTGNIQVSGDQL